MPTLPARNADVLGCQVIDASAPGMCADFFSMGLNTVDMGPAIEEHNRFYRELTSLQLARAS